VTQFKVSESKSSQSKRIEDEEAQPPPNVLPFPAARADAADPFVLSQHTVVEATKQVAEILNLSVTDDLARVVADYLCRPGLSLLGEADAAAEWLSDTRRNRKGQRASPAFFRRWVKRETESAQHGSRAPGALMASRTSVPPAQARLAARGAGPPGTPPVDNPYHTFVTQRAEQLALRARGLPQEEASHETTS
jgi:hypothetical protein